MASKPDLETRDGVVGLCRERRSEEPQESGTASFRCVNELNGVPIGTRSCWVRRAEVGAGERSDVTSSEREELRCLRRENAELMRANEILNTASAFVAGAE